MYCCCLHFLGVMQADPGVIREYDHIYRLYCHESQRVFHDRLVDKHDKKYFNTMLSEMSAKHFSKVSGFFMPILMCFHRVVLYSMPVPFNYDIVATLVFTLS